MPATERLDEARQQIRDGHYLEAIAILEDLLCENDTDVILHEAIGSAYFLAGKNDEAAQHFERITRLTINPGKALINLGAVHNRLGRYQQAVDSIRKGLQYEQRNVEGYYNLGLAHRKLHQPAMAVHAFKEALHHDPKFTQALFHLGSSYLDQGLPEQAARQFRKALEIRPDFQRARQELESAERAAEAARQSVVNPFGRLVDTSTGQHAGEDSLKSMTDEEREKDRTRLHELSREIELLSRNWVAVLKGELDAALVQLDKRLVLGRNDDFLYEAYENYSKALANAERIRQKLRRKVLELVAHEEMQHSPLEESLT